MNKPLLLKVKAHILEEPRRIWMSVLAVDNPEIYGDVMAGYELGHSSWSSARLKLKQPPPCGTVGCIAGWTCLLSNPPRAAIVPNAVELLGIDYEQRSALFFVESWPEPYRSRYPKCRTAKQRAKCVADRIDAFIESEGEV